MELSLASKNHRCIAIILISPRRGGGIVVGKLQEREDFTLPRFDIFIPK
jgi:hypothetical protein